MHTPIFNYCTPYLMNNWLPYPLQHPVLICQPQEQKFDKISEHTEPIIFQKIFQEPPTSRHNVLTDNAKCFME
ncbi:hypothetical protein SNEBB_006106, partial [Seison nebaliae]